MIKNKINLIFYIAIFFLPFENFAISPSEGWGAFSPLIFGLFILLSYKRIQMKGELLIFIALIGYLLLLTLLNLLFFVPEEQLEVATFRFLRTSIPLIAGISIFLSFKLACEDEVVLKNIEKILFVSYSIALIIGLIQYISLTYEFSSYLEFDQNITKRSTLGDGRIQFTFTEPSFIGMHIFGVLLPFSFICKSKRLLILIVAFIGLSVLGHSGVRILLDSVVVCFIFIVYWCFQVKRWHYFFIIVGVAFCSLFFVVTSNDRVLNIMSNGVYADGSLASRYFRINSITKGYIEDPLHAIIGYGLGQEVYPLQKGYEHALAEYKSDYVSEVNALKNISDYMRPNIGFCFYTRLISEGGLPLFLLFLGLIGKIYFSKNNKEFRPYIVIILYLYLQFGSYAFYSLWILLYFGITTLKNNKNNYSLDHELLI